MLAVAVLASMALARIRSPRARASACAAAVVLVAVEFAHVPVQLQPAPRPTAAYRYLATSDVRGAVVELPTIPIDGGRPRPGAEVVEARYAAFSTVHWRRLLNGYSGFFPPSHQRMVWVMQDFPDSSSLRFLRRLDVSFVTVHLDLLDGTPWERLRTGLRHPDLELVADDGTVRLYRLR